MAQLPADATRMEKTDRWLSQPSHYNSAVAGHSGKLHQGDVYHVNTNDASRLLAWFRSLNFAETLRTHLDKQITGTGKWRLKHPLYNEWLKSRFTDTPVLWCQGEPGVGKTVLWSVLTLRMPLFG